MMPPGPATSSPPLVWAEHCRQLRAEQDARSPLDWLTLAVITAGLVRSWSFLAASDLLFLAGYAGGTVVMLLWRQHHPGSFARWRHLPAAVMRMAVAASPAAWAITRQSLNGAGPFASGSGIAADLWNAAVFALLLLFCSFAATGSGLAMARPLCLWLHIPTQAATILFIWSRNADMCATRTLTHPAAQHAMAATHAALTALLPLCRRAGLCGRPKGTPAEQCQAVLTLAELLLGFLAPTLLLAAQESRSFMLWQARWQAWGASSRRRRRGRRSR